MADLQPSLIIHDCRFLEPVLPMNLQHLKELEDHILTGNCPHSPHLKDFTFEGNTAWAGTTPLLIACQHGELDSVKYIVQSWGVNVSKLAKFFSNPSEERQLTIEKATPLFVAALYGRNKIVRYLLEKGANVSMRNFNKLDDHMNSLVPGLTPLYGAVSDSLANFGRPTTLELPEERSDIVRILLEFGADPNADCYRPYDGHPMWLEKMCGIDATTALINHGLDVKRFNRRTGVTLLHHWASCPHDFTAEDSLAMVKLLVEKGAHVVARDNAGFTPLLRAAYSNNDNGRLNVSILDYLLERNEYSRMEKIEAMELAGAAILFDAENTLHFPKAFDFWRRAHQLREMEIEVSGPSAKKILGRKIGIHLEWTTLADLVQLEQHPEDYRIQALLVKLRISSSYLGLKAHRSLSQKYLDYLSQSTSLDNEVVKQFLDIRWGMLDVAISRWDQLSANAFVQLIDEDVVEFVAILLTLRNIHSTLFNLETVKTTLDLTFQATNSSHFTVTNGEHGTGETSLLRFHGTHLNRSLVILLAMIFRLQEMSNEHDTASLNQSLRLLGPCRLADLFFPACEYLRECKSLPLARVLLESGADPNAAFDSLGNSSLHVVAGFSDRKLGDAACLLLVEFGAKLHQINKAKKTPVDVWVELNETQDNWNEEAGGWSARPEWCCPLPTLLRLAARVIRKKKIPYADGATPANLHPLIELR